MSTENDRSFFLLFFFKPPVSKIILAANPLYMLHITARDALTRAKRLYTKQSCVVCPEGHSRTDSGSEHLWWCATTWVSHWPNNPFSRGMVTMQVCFHLRFLFHPFSKYKYSRVVLLLLLCCCVLLPLTAAWSSLFSFSRASEVLSWVYVHMYDTYIRTIQQ